MTALRAMGLGFVLALAPASAASAAFDGPVPLMCAAIDIMECGAARSAAAARPRA